MLPDECSLLLEQLPSNRPSPASSLQPLLPTSAEERAGLGMREEGIDLGPSREAIIFSCSSGDTKIQFLWRHVSPCDLMPALALCIFKALYHRLAVVSSQEPPGSCAGTSGTMQGLSPSQMTQALQGTFTMQGESVLFPLSDGKNERRCNGKSCPGPSC